MCSTWPLHTGELQVLHHVISTRGMYTAGVKLSLLWYHHQDKMYVLTIAAVDICNKICNL